VGGRGAHGVRGEGGRGCGEVVGGRRTAGLTTLSLDCGNPGASAGVGGVDSWGARPLPHHMPSLNSPQSWAFRLRPFGGGPAVAKVAATTASAAFASSSVSVSAASPAEMARIPPHDGV
jgi:hypothetical protein